MPWYQKPSAYRPFSLRSMVMLKVMITIYLFVMAINVFDFPFGSAIVCITPLLLICYDPNLIRYMYWQLPIGFLLGLFFSWIALNLFATSWPLTVMGMSGWCLFWFYFGETSDLLLVPSRIISIVPIILLNLVQTGQVASIPLTFEMLVLFTCVGVIVYKTIDFLVFPIAYDYHHQFFFSAEIKQYIHHLHFNKTHLFHALQFLISILFIMGLNHYFNFPGNAVITTALVSATVVSSSIAEKLIKNIQYRFSGNIFGAVLGGLCLIGFNYYHFAWVMIGVVTLCFGFFAYLSLTNLKLTSFAIQAGFSYIAVDPMQTFTGDFQVGLLRLLGVLYGCIVVYVVNLLWRKLIRHYFFNQ